MTKQEFVEQIEDLVEMDRGSLTENEQLSNVTGWDSLAVMSFIGMVDEHLGVTLRAPTIANAKSIADLIALVADKLEG
jgi:acyl carrier protein